MQAEATVNARSAALLTAVMNTVPLCVCALRWVESATSAGREYDKVGVMLRVQWAAAREEEKEVGR